MRSAIKSKTNAPGMAAKIHIHSGKIISSVDPFFRCTCRLSAKKSVKLKKKVIAASKMIRTINLKGRANHKSLQPRAKKVPINRTKNIHVFSFFFIGICVSFFTAHILSFSSVKALESELASQQHATPYRKRMKYSASDEK